MIKMPLVKNTKEILEIANKEYYAVGAFNVNNMEVVQAIIEAAFEERSPVIIEASEGAIKYAGADMLYAMVKTYAERFDIPVALHLDHGKHLEFVMQAIRNGFSSVMIDASSLPYEENVKMTAKVVEIAHAAGISVEAELGTLKGVEDNVSVDERDAVLVNPDQAKDFVERTKVDFLAPAIGTSHGAFKFKGEAKLDFERLKKVKEYTKLPLVLHGASSVLPEYVELANKFGGNIDSSAKGVPSDILKESVKYGINKVNTDTDLRMAMVAKVREVLANKPEEFDPRKYLGPARDAIKDVVKQRMRILGSSNRV
jgi:fructose-bisphosphate aldolase class II